MSVDWVFSLAPVSKRQSRLDRGLNPGELPSDPIAQKSRLALQERRGRLNTRVHRTLTIF